MYQTHQARVGLVRLIHKAAFIDAALLDVSIIGLLVIVTLSEISFGLWLLIRGGRASFPILTTRAATA
jgi:hypothetical protein